VQIADPVGFGISVLLVAVCLVGVIAIAIAVRRERRR
jgi:hypothetical protein